VDERELAAEKHDDAGGDDDVVDQGDECAEGEGELVAEGDVEEDGDQADEQGDDRHFEEFLAEGGGNLLAAVLDEGDDACRDLRGGGGEGREFVVKVFKDVFLVGVGAADNERAAGSRGEVQLDGGFLAQFEFCQGVFDVLLGDFGVLAELV